MKPLHVLEILFLIGLVMTGFVTAAPQGPGAVAVSSTPPGASVYLNSQYQGLTPVSGSYITIPNLTPGQYTLTLKETGYIDYTTTVGVLPNQTVSISINLTPATAQDTTNTTIGALVVIFIVLVIVFIVLILSRRKKKPEPEKKIEYD